MSKIKYNYFDAFERLAEHACKEAQLLCAIVNNYLPETNLEQVEKMHEIENSADTENHELYKHLANEFVTPIEREDIATLANYLDNIVDYIEDVVQMLYMFNIKEIPEQPRHMAALIEHACTALYAAVKDFRNFKKSKTLDQLLISVNDYEEEADKLYFSVIRQLFTEQAHNPVHIVAWYNIMQGMERCVDSAENAAIVVSTIIMKNN